MGPCKQGTTVLAKIPAPLKIDRRATPRVGDLTCSQPSHLHHHSRHDSQLLTALTRLWMVFCPLHTHPTLHLIQTLPPSLLLCFYYRWIFIAPAFVLCKAALHLTRFTSPVFTSHGPPYCARGVWGAHSLTLKALRSSFCLFFSY